MLAINVAIIVKKNTIDNPLTLFMYCLCKIATFKSPKNQITVLNLQQSLFIFSVPMLYITLSC